MMCDADGVPSIQDALKEPGGIISAGFIEGGGEESVG